MPLLPTIRLRPLPAFALLLLSVAALPAATPAPAAREADPVQLQRMLVTGSNIQRVDSERSIPISVIDQAAMEVRGALLPVDLLTALPSVVNLPENETRLGSSGARGDNANLNLRNLGATATLILVDRKSTRLNSSHTATSRMPSSA